MDGDTLVTAGVGPAGEVVALWSTEAGREALLARTVLSGGAMMPNPAPRQPIRARVTVHHPELVGAVTIPDLRVAHPMVQPLPDGRTLLVGARCRWRPEPEGPDRNGVVYDQAGTVVAEATLGDGINRALTSAAGKIWVGYFDEGIFGNNGWGRGGGAQTPIGEPGLICFTSDLQPAWRYNGADRMDDCYALNVTGEIAWACFFPGFPVVRIDAGTVRSWRSELDFAGNLLVDGSTVAFVGDRVVAGMLTGDRFEPRWWGRLCLPEGLESRRPRARRTARGSELHVLAGTAWLKLSLEELAD